MKNDLEVKQALYQQCVSSIDARLEVVQKALNEIKEALLSETKSSAGDKHETGRAMLQLEREKTGNQLAETLKIKEALSKVDISKTSETVRLGSVVFTSKANYFVAVSAGELIFEGEKFYAISPSTPIGQLLISKCIDDEISFVNQTFKIEKII